MAAAGGAVGPGQNDGKEPIANYLWEVRFDTGNGCVALWKTIGQGATAASAATNLSFSGTYTLRLMVTYPPVGQPPKAHAPTVITETGYVGPPTAIVTAPTDANGVHQASAQRGHGTTVTLIGWVPSA